MAVASSLCSSRTHHRSPPHPQQNRCTTCDDYLPNRLFYLCPTCHAFLDARIFDGDNEVLFWEGYACPNCEAQLALPRGPLARLLFFITKPIWWLPAKLLGSKIRSWNKSRLNRRLQRTKTAPDGKSLLWVPAPGEINKDPYDHRARVATLLVSLIFWVITYYFLLPQTLRPYPIQSALFFLMAGFALERVVKKIGKDQHADLYWRPHGFKTISGKPKKLK